MRRREFLGKAASAFASAYLVQAEEKSFALGSKGGKKMGPLRVHPSNPRYFADGSGRVKVDLSGMKGSASARWFNPRDGRFGKVFRVDGGGWRELATPDEKDWVLHIYLRR